VRVALLSRAAFPLHEPGGLERAVFQLATHLQARGVETVLLTRPATRPGGFPGQVVSVPYGATRGLPHGRVLDRSLHYPAFARRLGALAAELVRSGRVDVVHAQGLAGLGYGRLRQRQRDLRAPLVMNPQGMEEHKAGGLKGLALARIKRLSREAARLADRVIATDRVTRDEVPRLLGVAPERVVVLPNGVDVDEVRSATPSDWERVTRQALPLLRSADPVFLSVGRLEAYKGFGDILAAFELLEEQGRLPRSWAWVVVGRGGYGRVLERRRRHGVARHLAFAGVVSETLLHALYARADVFVHATHYEGSSLVTLEAMAHALPVVATRTGGIPDKVDQETGRLLEPGDVAGLAAAIAELSGAKGLRRRLGAAGRERVRRDFGWDQIADRTLALYAELLGR
jgi:glycosyltransferase involved in cell wall biosynthesis